MTARARNTLAAALLLVSACVVYRVETVDTLYFGTMKADGSVDPQYVIDVLKVLEEDDPLELDLIDGSKPAMFKSGGSYSYLVMPLS